MHTYRVISNQTSLTSLDLHFFNCTESGFSALASLTNLRKLNLNYTEGMTDVALSSFYTLIKLESLCLECTAITGAGFGNLTSLTLLHALNLSGCINLTDHGVRECVRSFRNLKFLHLGSNEDPEHVMQIPQLTSTAWRYLAQYESHTLRLVSLIGFELTVKDMSMLIRFGIKKHKIAKRSDGKFYLYT